MQPSDLSKDGVRLWPSNRYGGHVGEKVDAEETDQPSRSGGSACVTEGPFRGVPDTLIFKKIDRVLDPVRGVVSITFTSRRSEAETTGRGEMPAGSLHRPMVSVGSNEPSMK